MQTENKTAVGLREGWFIMVLANGRIEKHHNQSPTGLTTQREAELYMSQLQKAGDKTLNNPTYSFTVQHLYSI